METKQIENSFGRLVPMTRAEFVARWTSHVSDILWLSENQSELNELEEIKQRVGFLAGRKWDKIK